MTVAHSKDLTAVVNEYDVSARTTQLDAVKTVQAVRITGMGVSDHVYVVGDEGGTVSLGGTWDPDDSDGVLNGLRGTDSVITVAYAGATASGDLGNACLVAQSKAQGYTPRVAASDVVRFQFNNQANGPMRMGGVILHPLTSETGAVNTTSVDNGASSAFGAVANLHVTSFTGTSASIIVQDSANDSTWASNITFTSVTGATYERGSSTGTVDRYVRLAVTGTFSEMTFLVSFARHRRS